jgi:hypothetical protein
MTCALNLRAMPGRLTYTAVALDTCKQPTQTDDPFPTVQNTHYACELKEGQVVLKLRRLTFSSYCPKTLYKNGC